jgi:hypothetical protein
MIPELELVVLLHDVDQFGLQHGDIGTVVHAYTNGPAYEVEFVTADGYTVAVLTLTEDEIRPRLGKEILHIRSLGEAHSAVSNGETPVTSSKR